MYDKSGYSERVATFIDKEDIPNGENHFTSEKTANLPKRGVALFEMLLEVWNV